MISSIIDLITTGIDKIFPDAGEEKKNELAKFLTEKETELKKIVGQLEINKEEAKSTNLFVAGWRPAVGWICALGLAYNFLIYPFLVWSWSLLWACGWIDKGLQYPPELNLGTLVTILGGILGLGTLRTAEKVKKVSRETLDDL